MKKRYYALQDLFIAYFHEDWRLDSSSRGEVIHNFVSYENPERVQAVIGDLRELLTERVSEVKLHETIMSDYSLVYDPWKDGMKMRDWLQEMLQELEGATSRQ